MRKLSQVWIPVFIVALATVAASAQSFRVQCPTSTITHPLSGTNCSTTPTAPGCNNSEPSYNGPTQFTPPALGMPSGTSGGLCHAGGRNGERRHQVPADFRR